MSDHLECKLEWKNNFYSADFLKSVDYGCYSPSTFTHTTVDGVYGAYVREGVCSVHGVVCSPLGGISIPGTRHTCGARKE